MAKRVKKATAPPPTRELTLNVPGLVAIRLEELRSLIGAPSAGAVVARLVRFYDRVASSVILEKARVEIHHKDGRWEPLDPEEI